MKTIICPYCNLEIPENAYHRHLEITHYIMPEVVKAKKKNGIIKKIFLGIWAVIKAIIGAIQNYTTSTWRKWDEEYE
jgi:hypothetical protein